MNPVAGIQRVAVVGTGLIGSSWAALFLAHGLDVVATDPAEGAEERLRASVALIRSKLALWGLAPSASGGELRFERQWEAAVAGVDFVQENGPERIDFKIELFARLDAALPPRVLLASSTSGLSIGAMQAGCAHPERCLIGHPFNPAHLIPLVEIVGGPRTAVACLEQAEAFYTGLGKRTIRLQKEMVGHVANRLQAALWREAIHLVNEGVVSVAEVDAAVCYGPGLRWALAGPNLNFHLGGGEGGMAHFMNHLSGPMATWWQDLGAPDLTPEIKAKIIAGVAAAAAGRSVAGLTAQRDELLAGVLALKQADAARDFA